MKKILIFSTVAILLAIGNAKAQNPSGEYDVYLLDRGGINNHFYKNGEKVLITTSANPAARDIQVVGNDVYVLYENYGAANQEEKYFLWKNGTASQIYNAPVYYTTENGFENNGSSAVNCLFVDTNGDVYFSGEEYDSEIQFYYPAGKYWKNNVPVVFDWTLTTSVHIHTMGDIFVENGSVLINFLLYSTTGYRAPFHILNGVHNLQCYGYKFVLYNGNVYGLYDNYPILPENRRWGYSINCNTTILHYPSPEYPEAQVRDIFVDNTGIYVSGNLLDANSKWNPVYWKGTERISLPHPADPSNPSATLKNPIADRIYVVDGKVFVLGSGTDSNYDLRSVLWIDGVPSIIEYFAQTSSA